MVLRFAVPTLAGTTFSLSLLYLYHSSLLTHQLDVEKSILSSSSALRELKEKRDRALRGSEVKRGDNGDATADEHSDLPASRFQPPKYNSLGDEIRQKWNSQLLSLTSHLADTKADDVALSTIATVAYWTQSLGSSLASSLGSTSPSAVTAPVLGDARTVYSQDAKHTLSLRTPEERVRMAEEQTGVEVPGASKRI